MNARRLTIILIVGAIIWGCSGGGAGKAKRPPNLSTTHVTLFGNPWTEANTFEGIGAVDVPLLGIGIHNPIELEDLLLQGIRLQGAGNVDVVTRIAIYPDYDGNGKINAPETIISTVGGFSGTTANLGYLSTPVPGGETTYLLIVCDISPTAPVGSAFRAWVDGLAGDATFVGGDPSRPPTGRASSGFRTVSDVGMVQIQPATPQRRSFTDPGDAEMPALAAEIRTTRVEDVQDLLLDIEAIGTAPPWTETRWSLWLDGDGDGAKLSASDLPIAQDLALQPGIPVPVTWPGPVPAGASAHLLITADILPTAPSNALCTVTLTLTNATGVTSSSPLSIDGRAISGGVRVGTRGMVIVAGEDLAIYDPDFGAVLDTHPGRWDISGGIIVDPQGHWIGVANRSPDAIVIMDLRGFREIGRIPLLVPPLSVAITPGGDKIYASLSKLWGIAEIELFPGAYGGTVTRYLMVGKIEGKVSIHPDGDRLFLAQPHGVVQILNASNGKKAGKMTGPECREIVLSPTGDSLVGITGDRTLYRFRPPEAGQAAEVTGIPGADVAVSPDGSEVYLLTDLEVQVLDGATLGFREFRGYQGNVRGILAGSWTGRVILLGGGGELAVLDPGLDPRWIVPDSPLSVSWMAGIR